VRLPILVKERRPNYPSRALSMGIEGVVWIEAVVGTDGKVSKMSTPSVRVRKSPI
jgi:outer membrane biosynthesis protein TonB